MSFADMGRLGLVVLRKRKFSFGYAEFELLPGCTAGDRRRAVGTCSMHQLFLFSFQTHGGIVLLCPLEIG